MPSEISKEERVNILKGILTVNTQTGVAVREIMTQYAGITGVFLSRDTDAAEAILYEVEGAYVKQSRWFLNSKNSNHVVQMVKEQHANRKVPRKLLVGQTTFTHAISSIRREWDERSLMKGREKPAESNRQRRSPSTSSSRREKSPEINRRNKISPESVSRRRDSLDTKRRYRLSPNSRHRPRRSTSISRRSSDKRYSRSRSRSLSRSRSRSRDRSRSRRSSRSRSKGRGRSRSPSRCRSHEGDRYRRKRARSRTPPHSPSPTGTPTQRKAKTNSNPTNGSECKINIASAANVKQIIKDSHEFLIISDDFFYDFALNETKFEAAYSANAAHNSLALCTRGLTVQKAINAVRSNDQFNKHRVLINLGTTDICQGIGFSEICYKYMELVQLCIAKNMIAMVTTIMPVNAGFALYSMEMSWKIFGFNEYLKANFTNVIDTWECFSSGFQEKLSGMMWCGVELEKNADVEFSKKKKLTWSSGFKEMAIWRRLEKTD